MGNSEHSSNRTLCAESPLARRLGQHTGGDGTRLCQPAAQGERQGATLLGRVGSPQTSPPQSI